MLASIMPVHRAFTALSTKPTAEAFDKKIPSNHIFGNIGLQEKNPCPKRCRTRHVADKPQPEVKHRSPPAGFAVSDCRNRAYTGCRVSGPSGDGAEAPSEEPGPGLRPFRRASSAPPRFWYVGPGGSAGNRPSDPQEKGKAPAVLPVRTEPAALRGKQIRPRPHG